MLVDVREGAAPRSLTNAFVDPVRAKPGATGDIVSQSIDKLGKHHAALDRVYGKKGLKDLSFFVVEDPKSLSSAFASETGATDRGSLDALIAASADAAFGGNT